MNDGYTSRETDSFPLADEQTERLRLAALDDLRADGLDEESLEEIAGLWRQEDKILQRVTRSTTTPPLLNPLQRARINLEIQKRKRFEIRAEAEDQAAALTVLRGLFEECEDLLSDYGKENTQFLFTEFRVEGPVSDTLGGEVHACVRARRFAATPRGVERIVVEIAGSDEQLMLSRHFVPSIRFHTAAPSVDGLQTQPITGKAAPSIEQFRRPTLNEARVYRSVVTELRIQRQLEHVES